MGQSIWQRSSRAHNKGFQTKAPNSRQRGIGRFEELLHRQWYRLPTGAASLSSTQRRRTRHQNSQRTQHFVAGLSSVDPSFPIHLWDRLLPQAEITLNLLRTSRLHPKLSAAARYHGMVDYNKTAFAPPGCKIITHENPGKRRTWAPHGQHGYLLGPAMNHYRCQNVYISTTASDRIVDTLEFFPHNDQMPQLSSTDRLLMEAKDMTDAFQNPHP
jgi:hypothetical protein